MRIAIATVLAAAGSVHAQCYELDIDNSGHLNVMDVVYIFQAWGTDVHDFNGDGTTDGLDLAYLIAHADIFGKVECLDQPASVDREAVVVDVSTDDDIAEGNRILELRIQFEDPDDILLSVIGANVGCGEPPCWNMPFFTVSTPTIGDGTLLDGQAQGDLNYDSDAFFDGTGVGTDGGWWAFHSENLAWGRAGEYEGNQVRVLLLSVPEGKVIEGEMTVYYRTKENVLHTSDVSFTMEAGGGCYADFNADGSLDILDFVAFQGAFQAQDPAADCDEYGDFNIFDFVCFQKAFVAGCP